MKFQFLTNKEHSDLETGKRDRTEKLQSWADWIGVGYWHHFICYRSCSIQEQMNFSSPVSSAIVIRWFVPVLALRIAYKFISSFFAMC